MMKLRKGMAVACIAASLLMTSCAGDQSLTSILEPQQKESSAFIDDISLSNSHTMAVDMTNTGNANIHPSQGNTLQTKYAGLLGVLPNMLSNYSLYKFIDEWYGVRYRMGGVDKSGIDCSAFVQRLYEDVFCTNIVRTAFEQFNNVALTWDTNKLKEGDLVFFRIRGHRRISHVGIYLANNFFVHASTSQGVVISSLNDGYWSRFFAGAGKMLALSNNNG